MINYTKYTAEIQREIFVKTGYKVSTKTVNKILRYFLLNLSYEIKDLKEIDLGDIKLIPENNTLLHYLKEYPEQDCIKPSLYFKEKKIRKRISILWKIRKSLRDYKGELKPFEPELD
jgi:hypothetical protein